MSDVVQSQAGSPNFARLKSELVKHPDGLALYEDPHFEAKYTNLFSKPNTEFAQSDVFWRRPGQLNKMPYLLKSNPVNASQFYPGKLTPYWFPILITILKERDLFGYVVPNLSNQNTFDQEPFIIIPTSMTYCGAFQFYFRRGGVIEEVIIDDRLPTTANCNLLSALSSNADEFLPSLIEKAYAKYVGGYYNLEKEDFFTVLMDFTGGIAESIPTTIDGSITKAEIDSFYKKLVNMVTDSFGISQIDHNKKRKSSELLYQMYLITGYNELPLEPPPGLTTDLVNIILNSRGEIVPVVRLLPLAYLKESGLLDEYTLHKWRHCTTLIKKKYGVEYNEIENWVMAENLLNISDRTVILHMLYRNPIVALSKNQPYWKYTFFENYWHRDGPRGTCDEVGEDFVRNNQYLLRVLNEEGCAIRMVLTNVQRYIETGPNMNRLRSSTKTGVTVFEVERNRVYRMHNIDHAVEKAGRINFQIGRYSVVSLHVKMGSYIIIPWISAGVGTKYTLQVFSSSADTEITFLKSDIPIQQFCVACQIKQTAFQTKNKVQSLYQQPSIENTSPPKRKTSNIEPDICEDCKDRHPKRATRISVIGASDIVLTASYQLPNFFFKITCEDEVYVSKMVRFTLSPQWNEHFLFYRLSNQTSELTIQLFSENKLGFKSRIFSYTFSEKELRDSCQMSLPLDMSSSPDNETASNKLTVGIQNYFPSEFNLA